MIKTHHPQSGSVALIICIVIVIAVAGGLGYVWWQSANKHNSLSEPAATTQQATSQNESTASDADAKKEANIILSKVTMGMTKEVVIDAVGQPQGCSSSSSTEGGKTYVMEQCSYGEVEAPGHAVITFMNGKVWGTTYEAGSVHTGM